MIPHRIQYPRFDINTKVYSGRYAGGLAELVNRIPYVLCREFLLRLSAYTDYVEWIIGSLYKLDTQLVLWLISSATLNIYYTYIANKIQFRIQFQYIISSITYSENGLRENGLRFNSSQIKRTHSHTNLRNPCNGMKCMLFRKASYCFVSIWRVSQ